MNRKHLAPVIGMVLIMVTGWAAYLRAVPNECYAYPCYAVGGYDSVVPTDWRSLMLDALNRLYTRPEGPGTVTFYNKAMTAADTEYSQLLASNTVAVQFQNRSNNAIRGAWVAGLGAGETAPFSTLKAGDTYYKNDVKCVNCTLYLAMDDTATNTVEIEVWTY